MKKSKKPFQYQLFMADGTEINCLAWYEETPVFLMLHKLGSSSQEWDNLASELVSYIKGSVLTFDQRGQGLSGNEKKTAPGFEELLADFDNFVAWHMLGRSDKPILVGYGWSGYLALAFAAKNPQFITAVVLLEDATSNLSGQLKGAWPDIETLLTEYGINLHCPILIVSGQPKVAEDRETTRHLENGLSNSPLVRVEKLVTGDGLTLLDLAGELSTKISNFYQEIIQMKFSENQ